MTYIIAEPCINVKDKACVEVCPVDCIYEGKDMLYIHPDECIDCGACEPVCPVKAIFAEDETPANWKNYIEIEQAVLQGQPGRQARHQGLSAAPAARGTAGTWKHRSPQVCLGPAPRRLPCGAGIAITALHRPRCITPTSATPSSRIREGRSGGTRLAILPAVCVLNWSSKRHSRRRPRPSRDPAFTGR